MMAHRFDLMHSEEFEYHSSLALSPLSQLCEKEITLNPIVHPEKRH